MNILHLTNELNQSDGVSGHLFYLLSKLRKTKKVNINLICGGGDAINKFEKSGISISVMKEFNHKNRSISGFIRSVRFLNKFIKKNKIQILHSHNHYAANISYYSSKFLSVKTIQTIHGIFPDGGKLKHFRAGYYIAVNDHIKDYILQKRISDAKNTFLIYNGIDFISTEHTKPTEKIKIIAASRLEEGKGLEIFIDAVSKLSKQYNARTEFFIAGTGMMEEELKRKNKKLNAGVIFLGNVINMREVLNTTDIFVIPSEREGLPITMLEAAASRNIIISSCFEGVNSIIKNNETGLIFKLNNPNDLIEKIKFSIDNYEHCQTLAENFYTYAENNFNSSQMANKHLTLYSEILNNSVNK